MNRRSDFFFFVTIQNLFSIFQSWYKQCYDTAVSSLAEIDCVVSGSGSGGGRPREDKMHGALLVMAELLRCANANWERMNRELEELIPTTSVSGGVHAGSSGRNVSFTGMAVEHSSADTQPSSSSSASGVFNSVLNSDKHHGMASLKGAYYCTKILQ